MPSGLGNASIKYQIYQIYTVISNKTLLTEPDRPTGTPWFFSSHYLESFPPDRKEVYLYFIVIYDLLMDCTTRQTLLPSVSE